jgi:hypothetical protein
MSTKVYVLELIGDPQSSGGEVTFEVGGTSLDKSVLEELKVKKDEWLCKYLGDPEGWFEGDDVDFDEGREYTLYNTDLSSRPHWSIQEYDLL